jgi:hypothetical protein
LIIKKDVERNHNYKARSGAYVTDT